MFSILTTNIFIRVLFFRILSYYVILWNFTEQGIKNLKDCLQSIEIFKDIQKEEGIHIMIRFIPLDSMMLYHW